MAGSVALVGCLGLLIILVSCSSKPQVETVTIDPGYHPTPMPSPIPAGTLVIREQELPVADRDVEIAGDRIAEATIHLTRRERTAALRALIQARTAATRALDRRRRSGIPADDLVSTLAGLDRAERAIQHGELGDARRQLIILDRQLDGLEP